MSNKIKLEDLVYNYPTKNKEGFTEDEIIGLLKQFNITTDQFNHKFGTHTVGVINNEIVYYHCDILLTLKLILENRDMLQHEFD